MSYLIEGDYFESCNCLITCRCTFGTRFDGDACDGFFGWHVARGHKDEIDLSGLNVALARHRPWDLENDRWLVELYLDQGASAEQSSALEAIFADEQVGTWNSSLLVSERSRLFSSPRSRSTRAAARVGCGWPKFSKSKVKNSWGWTGCIRR